jgi:hypothetical protein
MRLRYSSMSSRRGSGCRSLVALIGKVFGQMQLAAAGLDPTLDRFTVARHFCLRLGREHVRVVAALLPGVLLADVVRHC